MPFPAEEWAADIILAAEERMKAEPKPVPMTPPLPPPGYELVNANVLKSNGKHSEDAKPLDSTVQE